MEAILPMSALRSTLSILLEAVMDRRGIRWFTLLALVLGERLMGIPGMILAPVVLNYLKMETRRIEVPQSVPEPMNVLRVSTD